MTSDSTHWASRTQRAPEASSNPNSWPTARSSTDVSQCWAIAPEIFGKLRLIPPETSLPWFKTGVIPPAGTYNYWADSYTLFVLEMALMGFAEHRRFQDWSKPASMGKQYFLGLEKFWAGRVTRLILVGSFSIQWALERMRRP